MSAAATGLAPPRAASFWSTSNGKKAVMAVTGVGLAGFTLAHLAGNLQIFLGPDKFNSYALTLRELPALTWTVRALLIVAVILHVWSSLKLAVLRAESRPRDYARFRSAGSTYSARTMYMSGPIIGAFVIYHLMQFTFGVGGTPYDELDAYGNVIAGFRVPAVSAFYILAMLLLCMHLRHGLWSIFQTLGVNHPRHTPRLKRLATIAALFIFFGFVSIPIAVLTRLIPQLV
ncbi:MAG TPA: succinate dehydrogenase cytochrome b subunit [Bryobacteraceae bacterium]|jgi:succinate dehydrogenase / fumarate reductase cytochrome b subunit|nr:succinate dehydrogenase cytochrome b subunit [Bryobacteraceae bacterium]